MDREAWRAAIHGAAKSWTRLSDSTELTEDNGNLPQKIPGMYCHSPCPQPCSRPPPTHHALTGDFWTPTGKSPVQSLFLSPGSWCTRFYYALQESISQSYVSSGSSLVALMATSSKRTYAIHTPRAPDPVADHFRPVPPQDMLKHSSVSVSVGSLGPGVHKVLFVPSKSLFPQSCVSSGGSVVVLMVTSSNKAYAIPRSTAPRVPAPVAVHC